MKYINKTLIMSLCALLGYLCASADTKLPPRVEVFNPNVLQQRLIFESDVQDLLKRSDWGQSNAPREKKHWAVFSDRDNNTTYASPSKSTPFSTLNFNEKVIIARIENGFALVYTDPKYPAWPGYSEQAVSKGWVPMENLLLWQSCPADTKGIYKKALLAANIESKANRNLGKSYKNPEEKVNGKPVKTDMTFYYIMKTDPKSGLKLLANQARLDGNSVNVLYGWVDENSFVPWNQRSCLEPNWKPSDVSHFNSPAGKQYPIYPDQSMSGNPATYYQYGVPNPDDKSVSTKFRMNPYQTRFPILDMEGKNDNIYKCTTFGLAGRKVNVNSAPEEQDPVYKAKEALIKQLDLIKHINIIFVIDGTKSMGPYFASVKEGIKRGIGYFDPNKFNIRVGAVIYRDYADGEYLTEKVPLGKPNSPQLMSFLDNAGKYGAISSPNDRTNTEALFKGLEVASDPKGMGFKRDESTIIVVVGDCGNDPADVKCMTSDQIVNRLAENRIQLLSFQVASRPSEAWELFNEQMCKIVKNSLTEQYRRMDENVKQTTHVKPRFKEVDNGYDFSSNQKIEFYIGSIRFPESGTGTMSTSALANLIDNNIRKFSEAVQEQIEIMIRRYDNNDDDEASFVGDDDAKGYSIQDKFIIDRIGEKLYKQLKEAGSTITFTGYAPKKDPQERDYWKPVAFMSREEFEVLMGRLGDLYNNSRAEGDRKPYVDAVKALIRIMVPDITEADMDKMGIDEVMRLAAGLNEGSNAVKGRSLKEIQDARVVDDAEYQTLINTFVEKYLNLRDNVQNKNYKYSFQSSNGQKFYWIPIEDLP